MKFYLVLALLVAVLLQAEAKRCRDEEDCNEGECCIAGGILGFKSGRCHKLSGLDEGCSPIEKPDSFFDNIYRRNCPCEAGLTCEAEEIKDVPFIGTVYINERCVAGVTEDPGTEPEPEPEPETEEPEPETVEPEPETEEPAEE